MSSYIDSGTVFYSLFLLPRMEKTGRVFQVKHEEIPTFLGMRTTRIMNFSSTVDKDVNSQKNFVFCSVAKAIFPIDSLEKESSKYATHNY